MANILSYLKDKIYYIMGATIILFIIIIIFNACSNKGAGNTYEKIENNMSVAAQKYYAARQDKLPKEENGMVKVSVGTLIDAELLNEITDPNNNSKKCSGYVEVTKVGEEYSYVPFLTCEGSYEPEYLTEKIKNTELDEYGNGVYQINGEYIYRGDDVNNYLMFNNQLWRIVKIDKDGDIKVVLSTKTEDYYTWDTSYNSEEQSSVGNTTNYLQTNIRKSLKEYYKNNFSSDSKAKMVVKNICIGKYFKEDNFDINKECSSVKENEEVSLLSATDYKNASLDSNCIKINSRECMNSNYLSSDEINTWLLNSSSENTYKVFYLSNTIGITYANRDKRINPVIYITSKVRISQGDGTLNNPYIVK